MKDNEGGVNKNDYLAHFGILGMKWGIRRYQNEDGSLTPAGKKRYNKNYRKTYNKLTGNYLTRLKVSTKGSEIGEKVLDDWSRSDEILRIGELETPRHPSHKNMSEKERRQAIDEAYYNLKKKLKNNTEKYLDRYGNTLMRDMHIRDDIGVKEAVKKALTDTSGLPLLNSLMGWKDDTGRFHYVADHY